MSQQGTGTTTEQLTAQQWQELSVWRAIALERMPYMASIVFALRPQQAPGLGTFAVDAQARLYIDFDAVASWSTDKCGEALLHEASHILQGHSALAEDAQVADHDRFKWNIAADAAINDDLVDAGCTALAKECVLPATLNKAPHLTVLDYFEATQQMSLPAPNPDEFSGCGSGAGGPEAPCETDGQAAMEVGATPAELERARINVASAIERHVKEAGNVPAGMRRFASEKLSPGKVPWRSVLGRMVRGSITIAAGRDRNTYHRRNARRHNERIITANGSRRIVHPGKNSFKPRIAVVRDTSASMSGGELERCLSEIESIARAVKVRNKDFMILDVDADVHVVTGYRKSQSLAEPLGGGGTDMRVGIDGALKLNPTVVIVMTDGWTPWPSEPPSHNIKVIVLLVGKARAPKSSVPPWAGVVEVED